MTRVDNMLQLINVKEEKKSKFIICKQSASAVNTWLYMHSGRSVIKIEMCVVPENGTDFFQ